MSIDFEEVKKTILNYEAMKKVHEKAKESLSEAEKAMKAITCDTNKLTKATYEKIVAFVNENSLTDKNNYLKYWLQREGIAFQKGVKYKGFEIKEDASSSRVTTTYVVYKGRKEAPAFWYQRYAYGTVEEAKKGIDIYLEAMKTIPPLMKKLGLDKLSYVFRKAKNKTVLSEERHFMNDKESTMFFLMEFLLTFPEVDKWELLIRHDYCSMSKKELECAIASGKEYEYRKGDFLAITPNCKRAQTRETYLWDTFHWGIMQKYDR